MKRTLLTISAAAWVAVSLAACRTAPSHPPTFNDLHELAALKPDKHSPLLNQQNMRKMTELFQAMQFTPTDLGRIRDSGDVRLLLGAVAVATPENPLAPALLRLAVSKAPEDPAPLADLAYRATVFQRQREVSEPEFLEALDRWRKLEPENSVPYYLEAAWRANEGKFADAARALAEASRHPKFDSYCAALRLDAVAAGEFAGYPKFTARYLALSFRGEAQLGNAGWRCLDWEGANEQAARDCIVLGKRLEAEKTLLLGEFMGLTLQSSAMTKFPQTGSEAELKRIVERVNRIREIGDRMNALSRRIPEARFVALLDEGLAGSEAAADEKLIAEYGDSAK
ncbi:MAG: hypothetical protein ACLQVA_04335 [Candidatus Brocadiia bacterium]